MRTLATQISEHRTAKGLSQAALARLLGVSRGAVHNWEAGHKTPSLEMTCALATALGCSVDELVRPAGERPRLSQDPAEWARGYRDGFSDCPPPEGRSGLAYSSGRVEGEADRLAGAANRLTQ